jgi:hypothetical protein
VSGEPEPIGHALNNVLCKIIGSAELALDRATDPQVRTELQAIIELSEEGAAMVARLRRAPGG